jgi:PAS domain S-box-containing protein
MDDITEFFGNIFESELWPARWHCGHWSDFHGWLYIISDLMIWAAYFTIPVIILKFVSKKKGIRFHAAYFWFAAFILSCGFTHLLDAVIFWVPLYRFSAVLRFLTALVSWFTIYHLVKLLPTALSLKSPEQLEHEVEEKQKLLNEVEKSNSQLRKQNEFIEKILDSTVDYILVFDLNLNLISVNKNTEVFLNKSTSELINKNYNEVFPDTIEGEYYNDLMAAMGGTSIINKVMKSATNRFYEISFVPLLEKEKQYAVLIVARDITIGVERENALDELNKKLNIQNQKLVQANSELQHFTYILSHDLQEPLRKIQTFSTFVINEPDKPENRKYLEKIDGSATRMKNLINDVLDYSKVNNHNEAFKSISLNDILESVKTDLELIITQKQATITAQPLPEIQGIRYQINQVFYNLIGNSLKYSTSKPEIKITYKPITKTENGIDKNYIELKFKDNGIGFDPKYKEDIFLPFKRLQNRADYEGTGIGLALVKKIVEGHFNPCFRFRRRCKRNYHY